MQQSGGALRRLLARCTGAASQQGGASACSSSGSSGAACAAAPPSATAWPSQLAAPAWQCQQQRAKHSVRMVLLEDHPKLGLAGELVSVKAGYARHTLFPSKIADYAVPGVLRRMREQGLLRQGEPQATRPGLPQSGAAPAAAAIEGGGGGGRTRRTSTSMQQLPEAVNLLSTRGVVVKRRYRWRSEEQGIVGPVGPRTLAAAAARQLRLELPPALIMLDEPIADFGEFRVPLNLAGPDGRQVELRVEVLKARRL